MVAAPRYGTATFRAGNKTISKEIYLSDLAAARVRWDAGDGAGSASPEYWIPPVDCALIDISLASGLTDTAKIQITIAGQATGDYLTYANHLNTLANRVPVFLPVPKGAEITAIQRA